MMVDESRVLLTQWSWAPGISIPVCVSAGLYTVGTRVLRARGRDRTVAWWETLAFACGVVTLVIALLSPLHELSEQLFSAHMVQHELLMVVAAPLLVVGRPMVVMLWALPRAARQFVGHLVRDRVVQSAWRFVSRPLDAWLIHALVIWTWHVPALFQRALQSEVVHAIQHLSFIGSALLFWYAVIHPKRQASLGVSVLYLFTTAVHTAVLGALITFARAPWYSEYGQGAGAFGLHPLEDQQLAGLIMWIPAGIAYLIAALILMRQWLRASEHSAARTERLAVAS